MIELLNEWGRPWAEYFGLAVVQNTIFLALLLLVLHRLRHAAAGVKQVLATVGLVKLLLPPFMPVGFAVAPPILASEPAGTAGAVLLLPSGAGGEAAVAAPALDLWGALLALWIVSALAILAVSLWSTLRLAWALRDSTLVDTAETRDILRSSRIKVRRAGKIGMPLTLGVRPRHIFVPPLWDDWTPDCRRRVLQHELAHIRRFDGLIQMLQIWVRALYLFHPLVHLLDRRLGEYREMACDDASAGFGRASRIAYSRCLVEIAESVTRGSGLHEPASALLGRKRELLNRVKYQTEGKSTMSRTRRGAVLVAVVLLALPLSLYVSDSVSESPMSGAAEAAKTKAAKPKDGPQAITVAIKGSDVEIASKQVAQHLAQEMGEVTVEVDEDAVVKIVCEDQATMGVLFAVQDMLIARGLNRVTYAQGAEDGLPLVLPTLELQQKLSKLAAKDVTVLHLVASGEVLMDGAAAPKKKVFAKLEKRLAANDHLIVSITADEDASFEQFVSVLGQVKQAGAQRIAVGNPNS